MMEPISPSVCRSARPKTARSVSAVVIARAEYCGCPPGVVRASACHAAIASSVNQTVRLPRCRIILRPILNPVPWLRNMMTMLGVMLERHGRQLPVVNGGSAYPIKPAPAIKADPCNKAAESGDESEHGRR